MKHCPECNRNYADPTLSYCLEDGAPLIFGTAAVEPETAILPGDPPSEGLTRNFDPRPTRGQSDAHIAPKRRTAAAGIVGVLLVVALAFGGYFFFGRGASKQIDSIAVMPFANETGDADAEYLSDGMTDTLINTLSQFPNLAVKARGTVFTYKGKTISPQQIGNELSVQAVLNGRVAQRGDQLTLSLELINVLTGDQIWGEKYIRKTSDLVSLQNEIARDVSGKLRQKLAVSGSEISTKNYATNPEAYQLYLKGLFHWNKRTGDDLKRAIQYFNEAKAADPSFPLAYAGLAITYGVLDGNTVMTKQESAESKANAKAAALKALELDSTLAEPHAVLAETKADAWDLKGAEEEYRKAIELNPNFAAAHQWYSEVLARLGRHGEAMSEIMRAHDLDPFSPAVNMNLALRYVEVRQYENAITQFKKTIELEPNYPFPYLFLGFVYAHLGSFEESIDNFMKGEVLVKAQTPESAQRWAEAFRLAVRTGGAAGYWRKVLEYDLDAYSRGVGSETSIAGDYARLGENDKAFEWLEKAYSTRNTDITYLKIDPSMDNLVSDPRFADLLRRVGLPN